MVEQVGRYIVKGQIGKGAMGVVYLAEDPLLGRQAAIKTVDLSVDDPAERDFLRSRLLRDARAAAGLTHPNIVSVYDVLEEGASAYLVLEFVPGDTLAARLIAAPIPDYEFTTFVLRGMAAALDYTHARGIVHRDIKPANVMITPDGTPKIMDFGIARMADSRTNTPTGMVMGTIEYMSPEQIKGEPLDGRSDQFALGAVAVRMLTGQTLYGQHSMPTLAYKIVNEPAPAIHSRNASLPAAVDTVIGRSLAKSAVERYPTCGQFVQDLATALAMNAAEPPTRTVSMPVAAPVVVPPANMPAPTAAPAPVYASAPAPPQYAPHPAAAPARTKKSPTGAIAAGLAVLAAGAGLAIWQPWKQSAAPVGSTADASNAADSVPGKKAAEVAAPVSTPLRTPAQEEPPATSKPPAVTASKTEGVPPKAPPASPPETETDVTPPPDPPPAEEEKPPSDAPKPALEAYQEAQRLARDHQFAPAIEQYTKALSIRTKWPLAHFYRARAYQQMDNCAAAIPDFDTMLKARPKYGPGYTNRGLCESKMKNDDAALADFEQALAINPKAGMALFGRGVVRNHRGASKKALEDLNAAVALLPAYPNAYQARAVARRRLGDAAGASADDARAQDLLAAGRGQRRGN